MALRALRKMEKIVSPYTICVASQIWLHSRLSNNPDVSSFTGQ